MLSTIMKPEQVEAQYGFPVATLKRWRMHGVGPAFLKTPGINGRILYRAEVIERWLDAQTITPEAEPVASAR